MWCRTALTVRRARGLSTTWPAGCRGLPVGGGGTGAAAGGGQRRGSRPAAGRRLQVLREDFLHLFVHVTLCGMAHRLISCIFFYFIIMTIFSLHKHCYQILPVVKTHCIIIPIQCDADSTFVHFHCTTSGKNTITIFDTVSHIITLAQEIVVIEGNFFQDMYTVHRTR